jgi:pyruvate dehydrogenase (quinone)
MEGDPKYEPSQDVPDFPYAAFADLIGLRGIAVDRPDRVGPAWDEAFAADRPVVLDMRVDPNVPPLPPHITKKEVKAYLSALIHGDPEAIRTVIASAKETWESFFPAKS